jgi:hypothetical protein
MSLILSRGSYYVVSGMEVEESGWSKYDVNDEQWQEDLYES